MIRPVLLLLAPMTLGACANCKSCSSVPAEAKLDFGEVPVIGSAVAPDVDLAPYLQLARAVALKKDRSAMNPPASDARRVFLIAWRAKGNALATTGFGDTLAASVTSAAEQLAAKGGLVEDELRIELDVVNAVDGASLAEEIHPTIADVGVEGYAVVRDKDHVGFVLPGEIIERGLFTHGKTMSIERPRVQEILGQRGGPTVGDASKVRTYKIRTQAAVESTGDHHALPLFRGMVARPAKITAEQLLKAVRLGADYLVRILNDKGAYVYMYHALSDKDDTSYGNLRHAGTTYALMEAYEEFGTPLYAEKAELAIAYMKTKLTKVPSPEDPSGARMQYLVDTQDEEQQKVGGAGLALLALTKHAAATGKRDELETMRSLARLIVHQQDVDGHFRSNADLEVAPGNEGKKLKKEPIYYPGEAALGLMRLYAIDPDPVWLETAKKAAAWVLKRDEYRSDENQEHDHWMSYTINDLYRVTKDDKLAELAFKIARAIQFKQKSPVDAPTPDLADTFFDGATTAASTCLEADDAIISLSRFMGKPDDWIVGPATNVARGVYAAQFDEDNVYWLKNQKKALGGVRESLIAEDIRIDYVQHAMSAWLHLARSLRDPAYGKTGVPSQDPVKAPAP